MNASRKNVRMTGKIGLIMGIANQRSIAHSIAEEVVAEGAEFICTYQSELLLRRVKPLAEALGAKAVIECDASSDESLDSLIKEIRKTHGRLDFVVHAIAFAEKEALRGKYADVSREAFAQAMDVSVYSLTALTKRVAPLMTDGGSILTLTYLGGERVMPHYNVMGVAKAALDMSVRYLAADYGPQGIRVNAISAGPLRTLAASGIGDFRLLLNWTEYTAPLRRNIDMAEVGRMAMALLSNIGSGITGEVVHVDAGYNVVGMAALENAEPLAGILTEYVQSRNGKD